MSHPRPCKKCGNTIFINEINGNWYPCDDETGNTFHTCNGEKTSSSVIERVSLLEKIVRKQDVSN